MYNGMSTCICLGVEYWEDLPEDVLECYERFGFRNRFDLTDPLLTVAALVHPGHKSLSWLPPEKKAEAIEHFMEELENVAESDNTNDCTQLQVVGNISTDVTEKKMALDAFFNFEV